MTVRICALVSISLLAACSGEEAVDLGSGPIEQRGSSLTAYSGSWDGYAEGFTFGDGSDRVRLTIDANGNGGIQVGDSEPAAVPPPTSGYAQDAGLLDTEGPLNTGFTYPLSGARVESQRLRAGTDPSSYFTAYCSNLTPHAVGTRFTSSGFSCSPGGGGYSFNSTTCWISLSVAGLPVAEPGEQEVVDVPIDCGLANCDNYCTCAADGCFATTNDFGYGTPIGASFDGALEDNGSKLVGTLVLGNPVSGTRLTVRLTRD